MMRRDESMRGKYPRVAIKKFNITEETEIKELENEIQIMSICIHPVLRPICTHARRRARTRHASMRHLLHFPFLLVVSDLRVPLLEH